MMITFQVETWERYRADPGLASLWAQHYAEFEPFHRGELTFGPDEEMYRLLDSRGQLIIVTARSAGELIGYCLVAIRRHPHYREVCGFEDSYYLSPPFRRGLAGYLLLRAALRAITARGVKVSYFMTKEFASVERLLVRLGGTRCDTVLCFGLGPVEA